MSDKPIELTREELYNRVWSTAAWKLGPALGLSGRGLGKLCEREGIPVPSRGFWARKACGQNPEQPKLPLRASGQSETFRFSPAGKRISRDGRLALLDPVPIPPTLESPHPIIASTLKASRKAKEQEDRLLSLHGPGGLTLRVSCEALDRALRILDAVVKALEVRGCTVRPAQDSKNGSAAIRDQDTLGFWMEEESSRAVRPLTPWQVKDKDRNPWKYYSPKYDYTPTGRLALRIEEVYGSGIRRKWGDGRRHRIEDLLPRAVQALLDSLDAEKARREERERRDEETRLMEKKRLAAALQQFQDDRRARVVRQKLDSWNEAKALRRWISETATSEWRSEAGSLEKWLCWIEEFIQRLEESAVTFPLFERQPTYDEKSKYGLWSL